MSENLIVCDGVDHLHCGRKAFLADLVAVVRRGVESGTIEGEVRSLYSWNEKGTRKIMEPGLFLVIPVDGGEDT